ncbi:hypothetical protein ACIBH1_03150 [Nonomuraea sp. NPDC050663]|uniref:hypothetical protein n=1 Tax=Nonomuraea sp. NPDC050663 TaxID=3364370 RepID=UPI00378F7195
MMSPCDGCGAGVEFAPGTTLLRCPYCGHEQQIEPPERTIAEHSYDEFLAKPRVQALAPNRLVCPGCKARTESDAISKLCQFCGGPLIADVGSGDQIAPEAVLPFALDRAGARDALRSWVRTRWFAPNRLKKVTEAESMKSTYLPHWTFDAHTVSDYTGQRGEHYWENESYTDSEGKSRTRQVRKTRWYPASGTVSRAFDDVLVPATTHATKERLDKLEPWPLERAAAFDTRFVTGHHSLRYDIEPQAGLELAKQEMAEVIEQDVRHDIGGDVQRVHSVTTGYSGRYFKLLLLPVWIGCYLFGGTTYQVLINGMSGEVDGDRPYSAVKIAFAVLAALAVIGAGAWLYLRSQG